MFASPSFGETAAAAAHISHAREFASVDTATFRTCVLIASTPRRELRKGLTMQAHAVDSSTITQLLESENKVHALLWLWIQVNLRDRAPCLRE